MDSLAEPVHYMPDASRLAAIREHIEQYNAERPAIAWRAYIRVALLMGAFVAVVLFISYLAIQKGGRRHHQPLELVVPAALFVGWYVWQFAWKPVTEHQLTLRRRLFPVIFGFIDKVQYSNGYVATFFDDIKRIKLIEYSNSENDDLVGGSHDGLDFELAESRLTVGAGRHKSTVFRGLIFRFTRDEEFPGLLVAAKRGNRFKEWLSDLFGGHNDTIPTGDPEIDAVYEIHTNKHSAARPIVEGPLVPALKQLRREWWAGDARIALRGREVFLLLPSERDYFALPSIRQNIDYKADIEPMIRDMVSLLALAHQIRRLG
jgi:hypothetical protein